MSFPTDNFTFGGASYRLQVSSVNKRVPKPHPPTAGEWLHVPYGGNTFVSDDTATLHTTWQAQIVIPYGNSDADAHYNGFEALRNRFASLTTPWGTFTARLADLQVEEDTSAGGWLGSATFEWS